MRKAELRGDDCSCLLAIPYAFNCHQPYGFQRPVIKTAAVSLHAS